MSKKQSQIYFNGWKGGNSTGRIDNPYLQNVIKKWVRKVAETRPAVPEAVRRRDMIQSCEETLERFNKGTGKRANAEERRNEHYELLSANEYWEDFLYYQNSLYRRQRLYRLKTDEEKKSTPHPRGTDDALKDWIHETDIQHLEKLLNHYDNKHIGSARYRAGLTDVTGKHVKKDLGSSHIRPVASRDLHLWVPIPRPPHQPCGYLGPYDFELDLEEINSRMEDIENRQLTPTRVGDTLEYATHRERREAEVKKYGRDQARPSTSNIRVTYSGSEKDSFQWRRTENGLFVSARETSSDWLTSYDCLGPIAMGWTALVPAAKENEEDGSIRVGEENGQNMEGYFKGKKSGKWIKPGESPQKDFSKEADDDAIWNNTALFKPKATFKKGMKAKDKAQAEAEANAEAQRKSAAMKAEYEASKEEDYDYDYDDFEFTRPSKKLRTYDRLVTTKWTEASEGRREWHIGMHLQDSSPPNSPPRAPIQHGVDISSIPDGMDDASISHSTITRCKHNSTCNAWWAHESDKCWIAKSESLPSSGTKGGDLGNQAPDEDPIIPVTNDLLPIPHAGREIYRRRLGDHYGMLSNVKGNEWPSFGIRVPYSPTTLLDEFPPRYEESGNKRRRVLTSTRSMAVPLIPLAAQQDQPEDDPSYDISDSSSDGSSDFSSEASDHELVSVRILRNEAVGKKDTPTKTARKRPAAKPPAKQPATKKATAKQSSAQQPPAKEPAIQKPLSQKAAGKQPVSNDLDRRNINDISDDSDSDLEDDAFYQSYQEGSRRALERSDD